MEDAPYVIDHRLIGRGHNTMVHIKRNGHPRDNAKWELVMDEFKEIPDDLLAAMAERYEEDMAVYGYNYTRLPGGTVKAECASLTNNGHACC